MLSWKWKTKTSVSQILGKLQIAMCNFALINVWDFDQLCTTHACNFSVPFHEKEKNIKSALQTVSDQCDMAFVALWSTRHQTMIRHILWIFKNTVRCLCLGKQKFIEFQLYVSIHYTIELGNLSILSWAFLFLEKSNLLHFVSLKLYFIWISSIAYWEFWKLD